LLIELCGFYIITLFDGNNNTFFKVQRNDNNFSGMSAYFSFFDCVINEGKYFFFYLCKNSILDVTYVKEKIIKFSFFANGYSFAVLAIKKFYQKSRKGLVKNV